MATDVEAMLVVVGEERIFLISEAFLVDTEDSADFLACLPVDVDVFALAELILILLFVVVIS